VAVIFAPVDVPFTIESVAKAMPLRQWILFKTPEGALSATYHDHKTGSVKQAESYQFDRGDVVEIKFNEAWVSSKTVAAGETMAAIYSNTLSEELIKLKNLLAIEEANKDVVATGQKQELIRQLIEQVNLSKADLKLREKTLRRTKMLYEEGLAPLVDLEVAENAYDESEVNVKVAEKALIVAETGEKVETISLASSKITSLKKEIAFLEQTQAKFEIKAPFSGQIRFMSLPEGDWMYLEDTSAMVLFIPVRLKDRSFVQAGQQIELKLFDNKTIIPSTVLEVGQRVEILGRDQVVVIKALVTEGQQYLPSGLPVQCRIQCGQVRVAEFLKRSVRW
jgi:hypothetical protein